MPQPHRSALQAPGGDQVQVCEHVLAACVLLSLDDVDIVFEGSEAPIVDGSAGPFVQAMRHAGFAGGPPSAELCVSVTWRGRRVTWSGGLLPARSRTFIDLDAGAQLLASGWFPGARPGCSVVLGKGGTARYGSRPRMRTEPAWHKLLDVLGDLGPYRATGRVVGELQVDNPSHASNGETIQEALADGRLRWLRDVDPAASRPPS